MTKFMFKSKYKKPKDFEILMAKIESKFKISHDYMAFLNKYNVATPVGSVGIKTENNFLPVEVFFGFSKKENEDLLSMNEMYENRVPSGYLAFASVNYGDLLCLNENGKIFHWDHEVHDLYFSLDGHSYRPQNTTLNFISDSFDQLLSLVFEERADNEEEGEDEYENPNLPFPDDSLDYDFKHPELFFKNPKHLIPIYLKKLELSEKGRRLLEKFKTEGLLKV